MAQHCQEAGLQHALGCAVHAGPWSSRPWARPGSGIVLWHDSMLGHALRRAVHARPRSARPVVYARVDRLTTTVCRPSLLSDGGCRSSERVHLRRASCRALPRWWKIWGSMPGGGNSWVPRNTASDSSPGRGPQGRTARRFDVCKSLHTTPRCEQVFHKF